jgi:fructuronate reductase
MQDEQTAKESTVSYGFENLPTHIKASAYKPEDVKHGVVHIGPGGFFMAHFAHYMHDYMSRTKDLSWGITVASLRSPGTITGLRKQKNLYVLIEREQDRRKARVLTPIINTIFAPDDPNSLANLISSKETKLVTMTVTNKGYYLADAQGNLDLSHHDIVCDLELPSKDFSKPPRTLYWYLTNGLLARQKVNSPLTILSLDNIPENSHSLKHGLIQFIRASGQTEFDELGTKDSLIAWIEANVDFLTTLVDRITPEVTLAFRKESYAFLGFEPALVIGTEVFRQLVVEKGRFTLPDWGPVGVEMVDDCSSYWQLKFLGLNAAHQVPAIVGQRVGATYIHEAMANNGIAELLKLFHQELGLILGADKIAAYGPKVRRRFSDSAPMDTLRRVGARGTSKASERILFSIERALELSEGKTLLKAPTFVFACWLLNLGNTDEFGNTFQQDDPELSKLSEVQQSIITWTRSAKPNNHDLSSILRKIGEIVRDNRFVQMAGNEAFIHELAWALLELSNEGTNKAIEALLSRG